MINNLIKFAKAKPIICLFIVLVVMAVLSEVLIRLGSALSEKDNASPVEESVIRPETVIFRVSYSAKLKEDGIWRLNHRGVDTGYLDIKQTRQIPPGGLVAVTECFHDISMEEQVTNELINLATASDSSSDFINVQELLEKKFELRERKKACEIRNNTNVKVDFYYDEDKALFKEGDKLGHFLDREKFKQTFVIEANSQSPIDSQALVFGARIIINSGKVTIDGTLSVVEEGGKTLTAEIDPSEGFRTKKIYDDKEVEVRVSRVIEMPLDEFNRVKISTKSEIEIVGRN